MDVQAQVSDELLQKAGFDKGIMTLVDDAQQKQLLDMLAGKDLNRCAGGSAANTIVGIADLEAKRLTLVKWLTTKWVPFFAAKCKKWASASM